MINNIVKFKSKVPHSLLGVSIDGRRLDVSLVRGRNGTQSTLKTDSTVLSLDPLTQEPELAGREIREFLDASEFSEKRCILILPNHWALSFNFEMPELSEEDAESFIKVQMEQEFPFPLDDLIYSVSRITLASGGFRVFVAALQRSHVNRIERVFASAELSLFSISIECCPLISSISTEGRSLLTLLYTGKRFELMVSSGSSPLVIRSIGNLDSDDESAPEPDLESIVREIKITLGQLPRDLRTGIKDLNWMTYGTSHSDPVLVEGFKGLIQDLGLCFKEIPLDESTASVAAGNLLKDTAPGLEFLPPRVSRFQELANRVSTRKNLWIGGGAAAMFLIVILSLLIQDRVLAGLDGKWSGMKDQVEQVQDLQGKIRFYRDWFGTSTRSLTIARHLTEAFPVDGVVWVRELEIKNQSQVFCSGVTRDNQALLTVLETLRNSPEVKDLKVDQIRGKEQLQFAFNYLWTEGGADESGQ